MLVLSLCLCTCTVSQSVMCTMAKPSQRALEQILRSIIPPGKRYILDLKVENDAHLAEIAESISIDGKSFARLLGVNPLKPEDGDIHEKRYYTSVLQCRMVGEGFIFRANRH